MPVKLMFFFSLSPNLENINCDGIVRHSHMIIKVYILMFAFRTCKKPFTKQQFAFEAVNSATSVLLWNWDASDFPITLVKYANNYLFMVLDRWKLPEKIFISDKYFWFTSPSMTPITYVWWALHLLQICSKRSY